METGRQLVFDSIADGQSWVQAPTDERKTVCFAEKVLNASIFAVEVAPHHAWCARSMARQRQQLMSKRARQVLDAATADFQRHTAVTDGRVALRTLDEALQPASIQFCRSVLATVFGLAAVFILALVQTRNVPAFVFALFCCFGAAAQAPPCH